MGKNKIALFDIDFTIFNAQSYRNAFQEVLFSKMGGELTKEEFTALADETYLESKKEIGFFDPESLIALLGKKQKKVVDVEELTKLVIDTEIIKNSLYEESLEVFQKLSEDKSLILGIFSGGRIDLQRSKISTLEKFFNKEHIHIFEIKKWTALPELLKQYKNDELYIIDDVLRILFEAKKVYSEVTTIWIKRGTYKNTEVSNFSADYTIKNLQEVLPILL